MGAGHAGAEPAGKSITNKTFQEPGKAMEESTDESKRHALEGSLAVGGHEAEPWPSLI